MLQSENIPPHITGDLGQINFSLDDFRDVRQEHFLYVDKTKLIEDILAYDRRKVILFTRPRRFGKSLNLSMLRYFFDMTVDARELFQGLYIAQSAFFQTHLNQYPVLYLNFKDVNTGTSADLEEGIISTITAQLQDLYEIYQFEELKHICLKTESGNLRILGVKDITKVLSKRTQKKVMVLVDEYDSIVNHTYGTVHWTEAAQLVKKLFGALFKSNEYLETGVLTGVSRIGKELGFSDMNNLSVCGLTTERYYEYFGFTEDEVKKLLDLNRLEITPSFYQMYNGYRLDDSPNMFNPSSVLKFLYDFQRTGKTSLDPYWMNSSANRILKDNIARQDRNFREKLLTLLDGGRITESVFESIDYDLLYKPSYLFSLLIDTGYLCPVRKINGDLFELKIPNQEILYGYRDMIDLITGTEGETLAGLCTSLIQGRAEQFEKSLNDILLQVASFHDFSEKENSYHNLLMGAMLYLLGRFNVYSNRESGLGRYDIAAIPNEYFQGKYPPVIIEFKAAGTSREYSGDELTALAAEALAQIKVRQYAAGYADTHQQEDFLLVGIGAQGKRCRVVMSVTPPQL